MMKPPGVPDNALSRIASAMGIEAQQEELFDDPELQQRPQEEIERDQRRKEGIFPIPQAVEMWPYSRGGYVNDSMIRTLDDFNNLSDADLPQLFGEAMTPEELNEFVQEYYGVDLMAEWTAEERATATIQELADALREGDIVGHGNTTYNWGWWGPEMSFMVLGDAEEEPYGSGVVLVSFGIYANYPHALRVESYAEEAPWYDLGLGIEIKTNEGDIKLDAEDDEAYHFYVREDQTGTWAEDDSIDYQDVMKNLNWEDSDLHDIW